METLWKLYQERLNELNLTFIRLLSEFQDSRILTTPELTKYRIEYLADIISKTLNNDQQKLVHTLYKQIHQLRFQNQKLNLKCNQLIKNQDQFCIENEFKQKSLGSTKVSSVYGRKFIHDYSRDSFGESFSSKMIKRGDREQKIGISINNSVMSQQQKLKKNKQRKQIQNQEQDELELINAKFKYLKL